MQITQSFAYQLMCRLDRMWENPNSRPPMRLVHLVRDAPINEALMEERAEAAQYQLVPLTYRDAGLLLNLVRDSLRRQVEDVQYCTPEYLMHHRELIRKLKDAEARLE